MTFKDYQRRSLLIGSIIAIVWAFLYMFLSWATRFFVLTLPGPLLMLVLGMGGYRTARAAGVRPPVGFLSGMLPAVPLILAVAVIQVFQILKTGWDFIDLNKAQGGVNTYITLMFVFPGPVLAGLGGMATRAVYALIDAFGAAKDKPVQE